MPICPIRVGITCVSLAGSTDRFLPQYGEILNKWEHETQKMNYCFVLKLKYKYLIVIFYTKTHIFYRILTFSVKHHYLKCLVSNLSLTGRGGEEGECRRRTLSTNQSTARVSKGVLCPASCLFVPNRLPRHQNECDGGNL